MKDYLLRFFLIMFLAACSINAHAISRAYDGDAKVWLENGKLCFGGETFSWPGGIIFRRSASVDEGNVIIYAVGVNQRNALDERPYWHVDARWKYRKSGELVNNADGLPIKSSTCIAYGQTMERFEEITKAKELEEGVYVVYLYGEDLKREIRAYFAKHFCLQKDHTGLKLLQSPTYDFELKCWVCK
jgi:hypothetical protein